MTQTTEQSQAALAVLIKQMKEAFSPLLQKDLYTQMAKEYKIQYDCFRKEGFTMQEALRLVARCYD